MALHGWSATEPHSPLLCPTFALNYRFLFIGHLYTGIGKILVSTELLIKVRDLNVITYVFTLHTWEVRSPTWCVPCTCCMAVDWLWCCTSRPGLVLFQERVWDWANKEQPLRSSHWCITEPIWPLQLMAALPTAWLTMADVCFISAVAAAVWNWASG